MNQNVGCTLLSTLVVVSTRDGFGIIIILEHKENMLLSLEIIMITRRATDANAMKVNLSTLLEDFHNEFKNT